MRIFVSFLNFYIKQAKLNLVFSKLHRFPLSARTKFDKSKHLVVTMLYGKFIKFSLFAEQKRYVKIFNRLNNLRVLF